jgi:two-component system sensor histidine kinase/response regulator
MSNPPAEPLLDPMTLLAACGGEPLLLRKLIDSFQSRAPEHLADLRDAALRQDFSKLGRTAHQLRGMVSTFSTSIAASAGIIEQFATDQEADRALGQCTSLADRITALCRTLSGVSVEDLMRLAGRTA